MKERNQARSWFSFGSDITMAELKVYFGIFLHMGLVRVSSFEDAWRKDERPFNVNVPVYSKCSFIVAFICLASREQLETKPVWNDDLYKWLGKGGGKKQIAGKADETGIIAWKLADLFHYIYHFVHEYTIKPMVENAPGKKMNNLILDNVLKNFIAVDRPSTRGKKYNFSIDA
eukprot:gene15683-18638_t